MSWVYILSEKACADNDYNRLYTTGFYDPAGKFQTDNDYTDKEQAAARAHYLNGGTSPGVLTMLKRVYEAEFAYGGWPSKEEIEAVIRSAGSNV